MPFLSQIFLYPIKSLDGVSVQQATVLASGALAHDREFAIVDQQGNVVNGKRTDKIHRLRSQFDLDARTVSLQVQDVSEFDIDTFYLDGDRADLEAWLSGFFGFSVQLIQDVWGGFPDDLQSPGPTVISTATLQELTSWFSGLELESARQRFRTNLEIAGVEPFWEDGLFRETDEPVAFQIGEVVLEGVNPCQRCIVPVRDALTGQAYPNFQKIFIHKRQETLPPGVARSRFNHFYRLAVNTRLSQPEAGKTLRVGDTVQLK